MAEAVVRGYPKDEIIQHHAQLQQLLVDMAARSSGGKSASGRYRAYDSAQRLYSTAVAFPTRQFGTRIDAEDWRLSIPPPITSRDSEGYAPPQPAQVSTPCTHRLDLRVRKDNARYILDELVRDGTSKAFRTHTAVPRGQTSVLVSAEASAPVPKSASTKVRSAAYLQNRRTLHVHSMLRSELLMHTNRGPTPS